MSPRRDKTVAKLVEKYRRDYPDFKRPILRKFIRLENKDLFVSASNLRKLDRHLKKAFEKQEPSPEKKLEDSSVSVPEDLVGYLQVLEQVDKALGSKADLTSLRVLASGLNDLVRSGVRVSKKEAELTKLKIERIIIGAEMQMKEDEYKLANGDLLDALEIYLKLVVDSLVKQ